MIRKILLLGALGAAGLALTACGPSSGILATAKTGDCFNVTGKDAMGQPKLIHTDCPAGQTSGQSTLPPASGDQATAPAADAKGATAASPSTSAAPASATPAVKADAKAVCQPVAPTCVVPAKAVAYHGKAVAHVSAARYTHALNTHRVWRIRKIIRHRHGHAYTETVNEYVPASGEVVATIGAPYTANTELSGGSSREDTYVLRDHPVYAPPPPPYGPPPPPPAYGPPPPPPPPPADARRYEDRRGYDSRSSSSQSYSSQSYSSSGNVQRRVLPPPPPPPPPCNCTVRRAPAYEPDGYLTWPNKTEY